MKVRGQRALLNKPGFSSTGAIVAEVEDTSKWKPGCDAEGEQIKHPAYAQPTTTLAISNCSRSVDFETDWVSAEDRANTLHKIDTMLGALTKFREAIVGEQKLYVERMKRVKS